MVATMPSIVLRKTARHTDEIGNFSVLFMKLLFGRATFLLKEIAHHVVVFHADHFPNRARHRRKHRRKEKQ